MIRTLREGLIKEAKFCLQQMNSCANELSIAKRFAEYQQTVKIIRLLPEILYSKDREARTKLEQDATKHIDSMVEEVIVEASQDQHSIQ